MHIRTILYATLAISISLSGCASYVAPGGPADFRALGLSADAQAAATAPDLQGAFDRKPAASFPANVALVRIQAPGYKSPTAQGYGGGAYSVVTTRDVEGDQVFARLSKLPDVRAIAPVNRLLLPPQLNSDRELRYAAAQLQADVLLVYTLDTVFYDKDAAVPISLITLGLAPTKVTQVLTTASAVLVDTRTGYVYGVAEASAKLDGIATAWNTSEAIDADRCRTETDAMDKLVGELETTWRWVAATYGTRAAPRTAGTYSTPAK